jgi:hypothetical protein
LELKLVSSAYGKRPSEILGVDDPWAAYQLDVVALMATPETVKMAQDVAKRRKAGEKAGRDARFKPLLHPGIRKVKIPESGIW